MTQDNQAGRAIIEKARLDATDVGEPLAKDGTSPAYGSIIVDFTQGASSDMPVREPGMDPRPAGSVAWHPKSDVSPGYVRSARSPETRFTETGHSIPASNLLVILAEMPLAAAVLGWPLAGRDPAGISRQPLE